MLVRNILLLSSFVFTFCVVAPAQDLTLDQILKNHEDTIGGAEAINKVQTLRITSRQLVGNGPQMEILIVTSIKRGGAVRAEMTMQGRTIVVAYDGTTGWTINPLTGSSEPKRLEEKTKVKAAGITIEAWVGALSILKASGNAAELLGKDVVKGSSAYKIKLTLKNSERSTYFLDTGTFLPVKLITNISPLGDMVGEAYPSDYRKIDGLLVAHSLEAQILGDQMVRVKHEKIEINVPLEDSIFKMPTQK